MTDNMFGGEVSRLEEQLVAARKGQDAAERNSARLAELLAASKGEAAGLSKRLDEVLTDKGQLEALLGDARGKVGRLAELERIADESRRAFVNADKALSQALVRLTAAEGEIADLRGSLGEAEAEIKRLSAEVDPARALAAAVQAKAEAEASMLAEARKIRAAV